MKKIYSYIYYRCYDLLGTMGSYNLVFVSTNFMAAFFAFTIEIILLKAGLLSFSNSLNAIIAIAFGTLTAIHIINYFLFTRRDRYISIIERFKNESRTEKYLGRLVIILLWTLLIYAIFNTKV